MNEFENQKEQATSNGKPISYRNLAADCDNRMNRDVTTQELMINRLVCNEMNIRERSEFLASVDKQEDGWKKIALAFVEEQALANVLGANDGDAFSASNSSSSVIGPEATCETTVLDGSNSPDASLVDFDRSRGKHLAKPSSFANPRKPWWGAAVATAATVLFSLAFGMLIGSQIWKYSSMKSVANGSAEKPVDSAELDPEYANQPATHEPVLSGSTTAVAHSTLKYPHPGTELTTNVPLYELPVWSQNLNARIPKDIREALEKGGYRIEPQTRFVRGQLDEQRDFVVPIHQLSVKSVVQ